MSACYSVESHTENLTEDFQWGELHSDHFQVQTPFSSISELENLNLKSILD